MFVKFLRHCAHVLQITAAWNEGKPRKVKCFEEENKGKRMSSVLTLLLTQYRAGDKIEKNEMGWACGAYG